MAGGNIAETRTASTNTFLSALVLNVAIAGAEIIVFTLARLYFPLIYEPRSFSISRAKRQQRLPRHLLGWLPSVFNSDPEKIKEINGLDCYFFVRLLRMVARVMLPIWLLSWAVFIPLVTTQTPVPGHSGLDLLIIGNIANNEQARYAGPLLLTWVTTIWIWFNIKFEMSNYVRVRQEYLVSQAHSSTDQACSVLVTGIPPEYLSELSLTRLFDHLPGGVRQVWINRDLKDMPDLYERRLKACNVLESAGKSLLNTALKRNKKKQKRAAKASNAEKNSAGDPEAPRKGLLEELVPRQERPSHRLPLFSWLPFSVPFLGKKVDTIEWACEQVHELTKKLEERRGILADNIAQTSAAEAETTIRTHHIGIGKLSVTLPSIPASIPLVGATPVVDCSRQAYPPANAAFILFNKQIAAHIAAQTLTHSEPYRMSASQKYIEVAPDDVIWENLTMNNHNRRIRFALSWVATIGLIITFSIPVSFLGAISNIRSLCATYHWLHWVCKLPEVVIGFAQGFLPSVSLVLLFMMVPIFLRALARLEGIPQKTGVELSLMDRYFLFQVFIGFLVVSFSSGIIATLPGLVNHPTGVPSLLAQNLPKSSTFFLIYVMLQGLSGTGKGFLQILPLVMYYVKMTLLASTPRSVYKIKYSPRTSEWGTLFPAVTQLVVITFAYSIISPIINCLAFFTFSLFYFLYKYLFTWVNDQPPSSDTGGLFFPKAMNHMFIGLYIQQLCLCALFFLAQNEKSQPSATYEGAFMIVLIVFTAFVHDTIRNSYGPLIKALPLILADSSYNRIEPEISTTAGAPKSIPEDVEAIDYADVSALASHQPASERGPPLRDLVDGIPPKRVTDEPPAPSHSLLAKLSHGEGRTDFRHPITVEEQRVIWLPEDPLGLVKEIEMDLDSHDILHSTEGAKIDAKGYVDVVPEDAQDAPKEE